MNATGHVQSQWCPKGVILTLHRTRCVLTSMNLRKNEIHLLYLHIVFTSFLFIICGIFYLNLTNKRRRKVVIRFGFYMTSIERYVGQSTIAVIYDVDYAYVAWVSVVHGCMNLVGPKQVHLRKLLASVNTYEPGHEKMCLIPYANNEGADQLAHPRSLISAFVVRCQHRMIPLVCISEISRF